MRANKINLRHTFQLDRVHVKRLFSAPQYTSSSGINDIEEPKEQLATELPDLDHVIIAEAVHPWRPPRPLLELVVAVLSYRQFWPRDLTRVYH